MKRFQLISRFLPAIVLLLAACGNVRELPTDKVITLYNSNMEKTSKMTMLDTLYVQVGGLRPNELHTVEALDPDNKQISLMTAMSDTNGVIAPSALWYDVGMRHDTKIPDFSATGLSLKSFYVHVTGPGGTDYKEPFYIVYSPSYPVGAQPKPIVWTASTLGGGMEHSFDETGTTDPSGNKGKTQVFVEARNIPAAINGTAISSVDIYILPSKGAGNSWKSGDQLTDTFVVRRLNVAVASDTNGTKKISTSVWDLDAAAGPQLINPNEYNNSYDVIVDVNQNGVYDIGDDINKDEVIEKFIDGIDGQGVVGFTVANTTANEFFVSLTDAAGNKTDTINETGSVLNIAMNNVPFGSAPVLKLYAHGTTASVITAPALVVSAANLTTPWVDGHYLPYVASTTFIDTAVPALTPSGITNGGTAMYDLVVSGVSASNYTATINVIHPPAAVITSYGTTATTNFDETGTPSGQTKVSVSTSSAPLTGIATVYVMPHRTSAWVAGTVLSNVVVSKKITSVSGNLPNTVVWDLDAGPKLINPTSTNNTYDVIVDANNNGSYDTGELASSPAFVVRDTSANDSLDLIFINIASGGVFANKKWNEDTKTYIWDWDYRDTFVSNGKDTLKSSDGSGSGYGIKAIWNPYIKPSTTWSNHWNLGGTNLVSSIYQGASVDVYIVDAAKAKAELTKANLANIKLGKGSFVDVAGGKKTLPVQTGCYNGAAQQIIWKPNFTVGEYYVIVDVNKNGVLDEGVDLIDAVSKEGRTMKDDPNIVGFTVVK